MDLVEHESPSSLTYNPQPRRIDNNVAKLLIEGSSPNPYTQFLPTSSTSPDITPTDLADLFGLEKTDGQFAASTRSTTACGDSRSVSALSGLSTSMGWSSVGSASPSPEEWKRIQATFLREQVALQNPLAPGLQLPQRQAHTLDVTPPWMQRQEASPPWMLSSQGFRQDAGRSSPPAAQMPLWSEPPGLEGLAGAGVSKGLELSPMWISPGSSASSESVSPTAKARPAGLVQPQQTSSPERPRSIQRLAETPTEKAAELLQGLLLSPPWTPGGVAPPPSHHQSDSVPEAARVAGLRVSPAQQLAGDTGDSTQRPAAQRNARGPGGSKVVSLPGDQDSLSQLKVAQLAKTQAGSKWLQKRLLKEKNQNVTRQILDGIEFELPTLMCDMYGNYLCSAAFPVCSLVQRQRMLESAMRNVKQIATDKWGTYSLQALIGLICTREEQDVLGRALSENLVELTCDQNGVHSVQKSFQCFKQNSEAKLIEVIVPEVLRNLHTFATNPHGLGFLKKCITECKDPRLQRRFVECMSPHALDLVQDPFGNYAVQHVLEEWGVEVCRPILQALSGKLVQLSIQKFSSNVVELMLQISPETVFQRLCEELTNPEQIQALMSTIYGGYVARRALEAGTPQQRGVFEGLLRRGIRFIRNRRLRQRWEKALGGEQHIDDALYGEDDGPNTEVGHTAIVEESFGL